MEKFEAAPLVAFLAIAGAAVVSLMGSLVAVSRRLWNHALAVPVFGAVLPLVRGTDPGRLRVDLLIVSVMLASIAVAFATWRRALRAGYRPEMGAQFMRALTPAEQGRFMLVFFATAACLSALAVTVCVLLY